MNHELSRKTIAELLNSVRSNGLNARFEQGFNFDYNGYMKKLLKKLFGRSTKTGVFGAALEKARTMPKTSVESQDMRETAKYIGTHFGRALQRLGDR